eukprot:gb/GEZJ01004768.1/.p1 GENE.gb/GEZJ01004768.1/~~gb/GEZJ01004768.1/.p1  ORF type:complete len:550 (-),score=53.39 gb/GEZJ01004768.1/:1085-2734(-)
MNTPRLGTLRRPLCYRCAHGGVPRACCRAVSHSRSLTPRSNHAIAKVRLHPDVYRKPIPSDGNLLERTIVVLRHMLRLHSTYYGVARLRLKALSLGDAHEEANIRSNWSRIIDRELESVVSSAVETLEVVVDDFRTVEKESVDDAGDFLAGFLDESNGTLKTVMLLLMLIIGRGDPGNITKDLLDTVSCWRNRRYMYSPELDNIIRTEVDRLVSELEQSALPMLHYLDIRDCVRRDLGVPEIMRGVIAIQACAEAGYEAIGDKWIREITCQLSNVPRGVVATPTPTTRSLMIALVGRLLIINGTPVVGLPTGDRWFARSEVEYCGGDIWARLSIISDLNFNGRHLIKLPLSRGTIRTVPRWLTRLLIQFIRAEHAALINSYGELMDAQARGLPAEGEASALAWERLIEEIEKDEGPRHSSVIRRAVNMRAMVGFLAHSSDALEFSKLFAQRLIASFDLTQLNMRGPSWEMLIKTDEAGRIVTKTTGRDIPSDLLAVVNRTIEELEAKDNPNAIPSEVLGANMSYAWPVQRVYLKTHRMWNAASQKSNIA